MNNELQSKISGILNDVPPDNALAMASAMLGMGAAILAQSRAEQPAEVADIVRQLQDGLRASELVPAAAFAEKPPYFIAAYGGFIVIEQVPNGRPRLYTVPNPRLATPFPSFENADAAAKWAVGRLYPPDLQYFALLQVPGSPINGERHG